MTVKRPKPFKQLQSEFQGKAPATTIFNQPWTNRSNGVIIILVFTNQWGAKGKLYT